MFRYMSTTLACLLAANTLAWAAADAPASASAPPEAKPVSAMEEPQPGDSWSYEIRDDITGKITLVRTDVVTEVTAKEISVRTKVEGRDSEGLNVYDRSWNLKIFGDWKYQPHDGSGMQFPLKVGANWKFQADDVNPGAGAIWKRAGEAKVVGVETIATKAGTFETFKIETTITRRQTNDPTRKMEVAWLTWYAPAIDHWVKRVFTLRRNGHLQSNNVFELVEYGRKQ